MEPSLADRLHRGRQRRFVGRVAELEAYAAAVRSAPDPFSVMFVHGPGGVGKSALLDEMVDVAAAGGRRVVRLDGHEIEPSPTGFTRAFGAARTGSDDAGRLALFVDTFEGLSAVEGWLRERFLPELPAGSLVILAGRRPPSPAWLADAGWRDVLRVVGLRNLTPADVRTYVGIEGLPDDVADQVIALTHGHPLALSLLVDALCRGPHPDRIPASWSEAPDLVRALLTRIVDDAPTIRELAALHVCARARTTTEAMLRHVLPGDDAPVLFEWLRQQTFVTAGPDGLRPHDIAREAIDADLRWRDPDMHADVYRRVRQFQVQRIRQPTNDPDKLQQAVADTVFLVRNHPVAGGIYWDHDILAEAYVEPAAPESAPELVELARLRHGPEQATLVAHWLDRQPEAFRVFRSSNRGLIGFAAYLSLDVASPDDVAADPGAAAMWAYSQRHGPPREGEQVKAWRFLVDAADAAEGETHAAGTLLGVCHVGDILTRPRTAWDFVGIYTDVAHWESFLGHYDFRRTPEADYTIDGRTYAVFGHDWRRVGIDEWLELTTARDLGAPVDATERQPDVAVLSHDEFTDAVKHALRHLHDPAALARNPLTRSGVVAAVVRGDGPDEPTAALRYLVESAAASLGGDHRTEELRRVLDRTFLRPAPSQEKAAEILDLAFSTYRRRRDRAVAAVVEWMWERELAAE